MPIKAHISPLNSLSPPQYPRRENSGPDVGQGAELRRLLWQPAQDPDSRVRCSKLLHVGYFRLVGRLMGSGGVVRDSDRGCTWHYRALANQTCVLAIPSLRRQVFFDREYKEIGSLNML